MLPERRYSIRFASASAVAQITDLTHRIDVDTLGRMAAKTLETERDRVLQAVARPPGPVRRLRRQPPDRRVRADRPVHRRHRRRGRDRFRAPPRQQCRLAGHEGRQGGAGACHRAAALRAVDDRVVRRRQVDDRRPRGAEAPVARQAHLPAGRRQRPPRAQPGSRLHRPGPGRKHPPGGRGREADGRCRADRHRFLHLPVPVGARDGPGHGGRGGIRRDFRRRPHRCLRGARSEGAVREGPQGRSRQLHRVSIRPTSRRKTPTCASTRPSCRPTKRRTRCCGCWGPGDPAPRGSGSGITG